MQFLLAVLVDLSRLVVVVLNFHVRPSRATSASGLNLLVIVQVMDFGYPQFTEAKILSEYIKTDAYKMEVNAMAQPQACFPCCSYNLSMRTPA